MEKEKTLKELLDSVRDIDGFPIGEDEDILKLSNPPYYTACPNPYINIFIEEHGTLYNPENDNYEKNPFISDVSEGKNDPIYNAHTYHTKVPYKAIENFISHYTEQGDLVFDGFCGSGMTGVASQKINRNIIYNEISPVASFIANNYNKNISYDEVEQYFKKIIDETQQELSWMYRTVHRKKNNKNEFFENKENGIIKYTIWSDIFICPFCENEFVFWNEAIENNKVKKVFVCPHCKAELKKRDCNRAKNRCYDQYLGKKVTYVKQKPVLINYKIGKKRFEKKPDKEDLNLIEKIENSEIPYWFPINRMPEGDEARRNDRIGLTHIHHFYTKRNLWVLSAIYNKITNIENLKVKNFLLFWFTSSCVNLAKTARYKFKRSGNVPLNGTLYVSSLPTETNVFSTFSNKINYLKKMLRKSSNWNSIGTTQSSTDLSNIKNNSIDYIFTDPPFGKNLMYSELNFIWESWLKVFTNNEKEAIINKTQNKDLYEYENLMRDSFKEMYRILKPNRWITVEFHNSKAAVWNGIQEGINRAGFIIAQVSILDKKQGSFKQVTSTGAVKNDLVINAYKPKEEFGKKFILNAGGGMEIDFVRNQLIHLPIEPNIERTEKMLYSRMLAFYMQRGYQINYDAKQFYIMLEDNFISEDGYWFLPEQIDDYREYKKRMKLDEIEDIKAGQTLVFVKDEETAVTWLHQFLYEPKSFQEIHPAYTQILQQSHYDETPELKDMLELYFIKEDGKYRRPKTKQEKISIYERKEKVLTREFEEILMEAKNSRAKIKKLRKEALLHGFKKCYQNEEFQKILTISDRLYKSTLENNPDIKEYVDIANLKIEGF